MDRIGFETRVLFKDFLFKDLGRYEHTTSHRSFARFAPLNLQKRRMCNLFVPILYTISPVNTIEKSDINIKKAMYTNEKKCFISVVFSIIIYFIISLLFISLQLTF